ncbi:MAG: ferrous iron transport protein [Candidatus Petromonas sp.]|jgi:ferrous iron transport protein A|nr:ferrous iron transport protein [Candidatus Petromonas sp.]
MGLETKYNKDEILLSNAPIGSRLQVVRLVSKGLVRRRMMDLGLVPNTLIEVMRKSPLGDPTLYNIKGALIALREEESKLIVVREIM